MKTPSGFSGGRIALFFLPLFLKQAFKAALGDLLPHGRAEGVEGLLLLGVEAGGHLDPYGHVLPLPRRRKVVPVWVPAGRLYFTLPSMVGISSSAPMAAW